MLSKKRREREKKGYLFEIIKLYNLILL